MKITLNAKLKAYSKYDPTASSLPNITAADAGSFVGVGNDGKYVLFRNSEHTEIDELFTEQENTENIQIDETKKSFIDSLF